VFVRGGHKTEISCNWSLRFAFAFWFCCGRIGLTVVMLHPTVPLPPFSHFPPISPVQLSFPVWLGQRANYPKYHILIYRVFRQLKFVLFFLLYCSRMNNKIRGVETKKKTPKVLNIDFCGFRTCTCLNMNAPEMCVNRTETEVPIQRSVMNSI